MHQILVVTVNFPRTADVAAIATRLVTEQLAACVNILPEVQSVFRWQGNLETAVETTLICKTTGDRYAALERALQDAHPYAVPEILAVPVTVGLPAYLAWVHDATRPVRNA